jgi:hypothetical protein
MKDKCPASRLIISRACYLCHLAGCKEYQRSLLVIVRIIAIPDVSAHHLFQDNTVNAEVHFRLTPGRGFRKVNHTHQWMQCFISVEEVIICHAFKIHNIVHSKGIVPKITHLQVYFGWIAVASVIMVGKTVIYLPDPAQWQGERKLND